MSMSGSVPPTAAAPTPVASASGAPGGLNAPRVGPLPSGYVYYVARYADVVLQTVFPDRFAEIIDTLDGYHPSLDELRKGGGGRTVFVKRFDDTLAAHHTGTSHPWGKRKIELSSLIDGKIRYSVRGHEIDMFGVGPLDDPYPGVAVEMEWNNKDPFFDRDLVNFQALHREGAIAIGVIVTRGPNLQRLLAPTVRSKDGGLKYGQSTTHWDKLIPRVHLGGGGECPLLLVGIEPDRIDGIDLLRQAAAKLAQASDLKENWRAKGYKRFSEVAPDIEKLKNEALELVPPVADGPVEDDA